MNNARRDEEWLRANRPNETRRPHDAVHNPAHYTEGRQYEPIDVIEDWELPFHLGNALKYIARAGRKDPSKTRQDISKAIWYLERFSDQFVEDEAAALDADELLAHQQNEREFEAMGEIPSSIIFGPDDDAIPYDYSAEIHAAEQEYYRGRSGRNDGIPGWTYEDVITFDKDEKDLIDQESVYDQLPSDVEPIPRLYTDFDR